MIDWLRLWFRSRRQKDNWPELEDMPAEMRGWSNDALVARLIEAAMTMGNYIDWAEHQLADRQRYIAAATLVEDAADELEARLGV